jgi:hypothetical protein
LLLWEPKYKEVRLSKCVRELKRHKIVVIVVIIIIIITSSSSSNECYFCWKTALNYNLSLFNLRKNAYGVLVRQTEGKSHM